MDQLFKDFLFETEKCMKLYETAMDKDNIKKQYSQKNMPGLDAREGFNQFYLAHQDSYEKLKLLFKEEPLDLIKINRHLAVFRDTARWFDYASCRWSENYDAIEECHKKIAVPLYYIDEKYKLGSYRIGEN